MRFNNKVGEVGEIGGALVFSSVWVFKFFLFFVRIRGGVLFRVLGLFLGFRWGNSVIEVLVGIRSFFVVLKLYIEFIRN